MKASRSGSRRDYLGPPGDPREPAEILRAGDTVAVHVWRAVQPGFGILGRPVVRVDGEHAAVLFVWPESGGWVEVAAERVEWFLVDPVGMFLPEQGGGPRAAAAEAIGAVVQAWLAEGTRRPDALSWSAFLDLAGRCPFRLEFVRGRVYAMAGGTPGHALVGANVIAASRAGLRKGPCRVFSSDLWVRSNAATDPGGVVSRLPDATIVCGRIERDSDDPIRITNPKVIFEVLSPSNRAKDTETNVAEYRRIPTLEHYVIVDISARAVHVHTREGSGWREDVVRAGTARLPAVSLELDLDELFEGVDEM